MSCPDHITPEAYEWAEIFMDAHRGVEDDRELLALAFMELRPKLPSTVGMTPAQVRVMKFIAEREVRHEPVPSFNEIGRACGMTSSSAVHRAVHGLAKRGAITLEPHRARSIALVGAA